MINSIPDDGFNPRHEIAVLYKEVGTLSDVLETIADDSTDDDLEIVLDWAFQLRQKHNLNWNEAIIAAEIAYYG